MISSAIARSSGSSVFVTVGVPVAFLVCGVMYMSRRKKSDDGQDGKAEFAESGRVRMTVRLPLRSYRIFSEELPQGISGFENTGLYELYSELAGRIRKK